MLERRIPEVANRQKNQGAEPWETKLVVLAAIWAWKRLERYFSTVALKPLPLLSGASAEFDFLELWHLQSGPGPCAAPDIPVL